MNPIDQWREQLTLMKVQNTSFKIAYERYVVKFLGKTFKPVFILTIDDTEKILSWLSDHMYMKNNFDSLSAPADDEPFYSTPFDCLNRVAVLSKNDRTYFYNLIQKTLEEKEFFDSLDETGLKIEDYYLIEENDK